MFGLSISDHRGQNVISTIGDFDFLFNNSWFNTSSNLSGQHQQLINLESNLTADDYSIGVSYNGSDDYAPSSGIGLLRVKAEIGWNISISQDWTHLGDELWINGSIFDGSLPNTYTWR